jgi:succinate dehydrogenase / fumarate reductase membrane anchor subunit
VTRSPHGLRAWMLQRLSAVYLGIFLLYFCAAWLLGRPYSWQDWHSWMSHPLMRSASAGFILALLIHAWIGMRDIVLDYIHPLGVRLTVLTLIGLVLGGCGLWALHILLVAAA